MQDLISEKWRTKWKCEQLNNGSKGNFQKISHVLHWQPKRATSDAMFAPSLNFQHLLNINNKQPLKGQVLYESPILNWTSIAWKCAIWRGGLQFCILNTYKWKISFQHWVTFALIFQLFLLCQILERKIRVSDFFIFIFIWKFQAVFWLSLSIEAQTVSSLSSWKHYWAQRSSRSLKSETFWKDISCSFLCCGIQTYFS